MGSPNELASDFPDPFLFVLAVYHGRIASVDPAWVVRDFLESAIFPGRRKSHSGNSLAIRLNNP